MAIKLRTPGGERTMTALCTMFWGGVFFWFGLGSWGKEIVGGQDSVLVVMGGMLIGAGGLLWCRFGWARWPTIGVIALIAAPFGWGLLTRGFSVWSVIALAGLLWLAWDVFRQFSPEALADQSTPGGADSKPMISLALLLRRSRYLDASGLARYCEAAWGGTYRVLEEGRSAPDTKGESEPRWVGGRSPYLFVWSPSGLFVVHNHREPYFDQSAKHAVETRDLRLRQLFDENRAWMAVDLMIPRPAEAPRESFYSPIARLIAELAGPDCQAIYRPETQQFNHWDDSLETKLRGPDALELFAEPTQIPVIEVAEDDPRMQAAVTEARQKWPEFVAAFRGGDGELFSVKAPVHAGGNTEFIWIQVDELDEQNVRGKLGNAPVDLGGLKEGDRVTVPVSEIGDWAYVKNGHPCGMFTLQVLQAIQRESRPPNA